MQGPIGIIGIIGIGIIGIIRIIGYSRGAQVALLLTAPAEAESLLRPFREREGSRTRAVWSPRGAVRGPLGTARRLFREREGSRTGKKQRQLQ